MLVAYQAASTLRRQQQRRNAASTRQDAESGKDVGVPRMHTQLDALQPTTRLQVQRLADMAAANTLTTAGSEPGGGL